MNKSILLSFFFTITFTITALAQVGSIKGNVTDAKNKEAAIGATVKVEGTTIGAMTDIEGNFEMKRVPAGIYKISVTYVGYQTKVIANVRVEADKESILNVAVEEDSKTLETVVVKAQRLTSTDVAVISEIKTIQQIAVGISGQQIQKTQDRDASAVVRRVPGVSIFDERFVVVRGLNERYNTVLLNDVITPSTEIDSKAFSFDLIPSSAIDRMLVFKSASSDLPGDMGGGAIKIYTKTVPDGNNLSASFSMSYRPNTTGINYDIYQGGKTDWLGFDDGTRALPARFPSRNSIALAGNTEAVISKFRQMPDFYNVQNTTVLPDFRGNINFSHRWFIGSKELTNISYINYSNTNQGIQMTQNRFTFDGDVERQFNDRALNQNVRLGAMSNWAFIINPKNKIEFRNLFNQMGIKETVFRSGFNENVDLDNASFRYEQRSIYSGQLSGTHELNKTTKLKWIGGLGYTFRLEPDYRRYTRSRQKGTNDPFTIDLQQSDSPTLQQAARSFSVLDELVFTGRVDIDKILKENDDEKLRTTLKVGAYGDYKDRIFSNRWYGITNPNRLSGDNKLLSSSPEEFFRPENLGGNSVYYGVGTNFEDKYQAQNLLAAAYAQVYHPFSEKFNATVGFRGEYNNQTLQSRERGSGSKVEVENPVFSPLPSLNLAYNINKKHLIRAAYSLTVNRPEFRELAPFTYYDFVYDVTRTGFVPRPDKPRLLNASISNIDLRYEFYPSEGEMITVALFDKQFKNPIEAKVFYNGSTVAFTVDNADRAFSRGVEVEFRKQLSQKWMAIFNGALIQSNVRAGQGQNSLERSLQGQSPYLLNAGLFYDDAKRGLQANVLYNVIGKRIFVIGDNQLSADIYEMPRNVIDVSVTKTLNKRMDLRVSIQDLLNQKFRLIQDTDRDSKITANDGTYQEFRRGSYGTVGLTIKF
ncbi:MAG: TonB-dependent receptor [Spirosomaceae bacterium]|nr:TonB-dependent receptor [Spirosomataceae bacterium]